MAIYTKASDPHAGIRGFLQGLVGEMARQQHQQQVSQDIRDIGRWSKEGGNLPQLKTQEGNQALLQQIIQQADPLYQSRLKANRALAEKRTAQLNQPFPRGYTERQLDVLGLSPRELAAQNRFEYQQEMEAVKRFTPGELDTREMEMKAILDETGGLRPFRYNYRKKEILDAWERYKQTIGYDGFTKEKKKQIWSRWNKVVKKLGSEAEWKINDPDIKASSGLSRTIPSGRKKQSLTAPEGMEDVWDKISPKDKLKIKQYLNKGYSIEDIKRALK